MCAYFIDMSTDKNFGAKSFFSVFSLPSKGYLRYLSSVFCILFGTLISLGVFFRFLISCFISFLYHILELGIANFHSLLFKSLQIKIENR